jgi:OOP family OmpA-OmpF porin
MTRSPHRSPVPRSRWSPPLCRVRGAVLPALAAGALALALGAQAQAPAPAPARGATPVPPLPPQGTVKTDAVTRGTSLPARGLFDGDKLTREAEEKLTLLIIDAVGRQVEVALLMPTGPWRVEGGTRDERDLTPARLEAIKSFLAARGIDRRRIFVESRVDQKLREPRLDVQIIDRPAND